MSFKRGVILRSICDTAPHEKLDIVIVATNAPPLIGGLEVLSLRLAQQMVTCAHNVKIVARFNDKRRTLREYFTSTPQASLQYIDNIPVQTIQLSLLSRLVLLPVFRLIWRRLTFPIARWLYVQSVSPALLSECKEAQLIHFIGTGCELLGYAALRVSRILGIPFVVEPALHEGHWGDQWYDLMLYKLSDHIIAHSRHEASVLRRLGLRDDVVSVVTHGADILPIGKSSRFRDYCKVKGLILLFLGRKSFSKGVHLCLEAWQAIRSVFPESVLILAGPSPDPALAEQLGLCDPCQLSESGIININDLDDQMKHDALAACDVLCVPSEGESFGMVYLEACAYGKPIVALDLPVLRETIGESRAALLVDSRPSSIASAVIALFSSDQLRFDLGRCGRSLAGRHSWPNAAKGYLTCYASLVYPR